MLSVHVGDENGYDIEYGDDQLNKDTLSSKKPIQFSAGNEENSFAWLLLFPILIIVTILAFGTPCWYCYSYRFTKAQAKGKPQVSGPRRKPCIKGEEVQENYEAAWQRTIQEAQRQWRIYQILSIAILPALVKTFVASPTQECLLADIFASVALLGAVMQVVATTIYKECIETFRQSNVIEEWIKASDKMCYSPKSLLFWIFLSTPTIWFWSSIVTGALSFVLSTWAEGYPGATSGLCPSTPTNLLPSVTAASALIALTDLMFMVLTLQSFALNNKD